MIGAEILRDIEFLGEAKAVVRSHHERWDGSGYPDGLAGEEIPLAARVFAVADALDALTTDRPYRPASPLAEARAMIAAGPARSSTPRVVEALRRRSPTPTLERHPRARSSRMQQRVLIVDDDPFIRKLIATTLEDVAEFELLRGRRRRRGARGGRARAARDSSSSTSTCRGWTASRCAGGCAPHPTTGGATIVMLTAAAGDGAERAAPRRAGADLFLTKPFSPLDLLRLAEGLTDGR